MQISTPTISPRKQCTLLADKANRCRHGFTPGISAALNVQSQIFAPEWTYRSNDTLILTHSQSVRRTASFHCWAFLGTDRIGRRPIAALETFIFNFFHVGSWSKKAEQNGYIWIDCVIEDGVLDEDASDFVIRRHESWWEWRESGRSMSIWVVRIFKYRSKQQKRPISTSCFQFHLRCSGFGQGRALATARAGIRSWPTSWYSKSTLC